MSRGHSEGAQITHNVPSGAATRGYNRGAGSKDMLHGGHTQGLESLREDLQSSGGIQSRSLDASVEDMSRHGEESD